MKTDIFGKELKEDDYVAVAMYGVTTVGKIYKFTEKTIGLVVIPSTKQRWSPYISKTLNEVIKLDDTLSAELEEKHGKFIYELLEARFS